MILLLLLTFVAACFLITPWILMLVLGGIAHTFDVPQLALGFGACILISILLNIVGAAFRSTSK